MKYAINSEEYWNERFHTDWKEYSGNEQTKYFASILNDMLPGWLVREANENCDKICDLGCAEGDALPIYKKLFHTSELYGEDFSEAAITEAQGKYSEFSFKVSNILTPEHEEKYPIVICSNVVEHFKDTYTVIAKVCQRATKYAIILIPYREEIGAIDEHERVFHTKDIPLRVEDSYLVYTKSLTCNSVYYPYEQILLIYAKDFADYMLSDLSEGIDTDSGKHLREKTEAQIEVLQKKLKDMEDDLYMAVELLQQKDDYISQAQNLSDNFATGKLMKLNHFLFRFKGQLLRGTKEERKEFWSWLRGRYKGTNRSIGAGVIYNPWMVVNEKLDEAIACKFKLMAFNGSLVPTSGLGNMSELSVSAKKIIQNDYKKYDVIILSVIDYDFRHQRPQHFAARFAANGHRVFYVNANFIRRDSVTAKADNLYVVDFKNIEYNAIYGMSGDETLEWMQEKLSLLIDSYAIRDAILVVDYPNWVYGAEFVRDKYGFKIATDYMDDYTGFLGTAEDFLKDNCIRLLRMSDVVVTSSQFLYEVACKYADADKIEIVRNGTEVKHFNQAVEMQSEHKARRVIGYYGAVSHWFAWEKVCYLAEKMPECDIVIVGEVTEHKEKLERYHNIKLLGEKPYQELPKYLADFDVCLIPFDTSTDLIKATNPVKFYEYLSAGKKVVATEIPELMPFRDEYVYMSNEDEKFAQYVQMCLDGSDTLKGEEKCISFAAENDWQERFEAFEQACVTRLPKVSVIVLAYNNEDMNRQCINSILSKTAYAKYELIVVDNHSTDGTVEYLRDLANQNLPNVTVIINEENLGFAGGNNCGIKAATGEYVVLLNNDTVVTRGWLTNLVKHLECNSYYGMCNPVTNSIGNESKIRVRYTNVNEMEEFAYQYTMSHMGEEYRGVDRLPLFATIIRKDVIDLVGLLDEEYKVGMFEDDDFAERVRQAGYQMVIAEDAFIHHINNGSFGKMDDVEYKRVFEANKKIFEKKWNKKWTMPKYRQGVGWGTNRDVSI